MLGISTADLCAITGGVLGTAITGGVLGIGCQTLRAEKRNDGQWYYLLHYQVRWTFHFVSLERAFLEGSALFSPWGFGGHGNSPKTHGKK